ncbi:hypothetical protein GCM10009676_22380 [Prauserella halophila]|uniref:Uncharacterized protein n=1 Tax=Prauserella halophila TaxID=185641 RepID=A0ABN1W654_9PSEU|nr:hypothetical protein [Prauserella halophila]MCP2235569.1 hypothetical protein [Prauserella halophila]
MDLTEERFRALARSAPWRWRTLRFTTGRRRTGEHRAVHTVRAYVRKPGRQRVETLDGVVLDRSTDPDTTEPPVVDLDADGLLAHRPDQVPAVRFSCEPPMYENYHWVAMLDPYELTDGWSFGDDGDNTDGDDRDGPATSTEILELTEVEHHGRPAWQARLRTTRFYDPRCGCCPLLYSAESEAAENHEPPHGTVFADTYVIRLDVATGVCVYSEDVGGTDSGQGHDVAIEGADEDMPDELFGKPRSHRHRFQMYRTADEPGMSAAYRDDATPGRFIAGPDE